MSKRPFEQLGYCIQSVSLGASRRIHRVADAKFQVMFEYIFFKITLKITSVKSEQCIGENFVFPL